MAVPTPRALFACAIPTIIVILSYIWFRKKETRTPDKRLQQQQQQNRLQQNGIGAAASSTPVVCSSNGFSNNSSDSARDTLDEVSTVHLESTPLVDNRPVAMAGSKDDDDHHSVAPTERVDNHLPGHVEQCDEACSSSASTSSEEEMNMNTTTAVEVCRLAVEQQLTVDEVVVVNGHHHTEKDVEVNGERESFLNTSEDTCLVSTSVDTDAELVSSDCPPADSSDLCIGEEEEAVYYYKVVVDAETSLLPDDEGMTMLSCDHPLIEDDEAVVRVVVAAKSEEGEVEIQQPEAPGPGELVSGDEPELQELSGETVVVAVDVVGGHGNSMSNGTSTSAYGSASHSPAEELLDSPTASTYSDLHSEGSSDSGKGGSDIHTPANGEISSLVVENGSVVDSVADVADFAQPLIQIYELEIPQELCGRLIGYKGANVNQIKSKTRANISIKQHPFDPLLKICAVIGSEDSIASALMMIRRRFPTNKYPDMNMLQVNAPLVNGIPIPENMQLQLPDGVPCEVALSSLINAGHFFMQQVTHPTYPRLHGQDLCMLNCYLDGTGAPEVPRPIELGIICAASTMGGWYRAQVVYLYPDTDDCDVKFVDYGGYSRETTSSLRQIRSDFMTLPFQASECILGSVVPIDESEGWTPEANSFFEQLAQGQILQGQIVGYSEDGIPHLHLYRFQGAITTFINRDMVSYGHARWVSHEE